MGGKPFTCAAVLPRDETGNAAAVPRLAIGSSDGTVRVLNGFRAEALVGLFGAKGSAAVCAMAVVPIHGRDALVTGALSKCLFAVPCLRMLSSAATCGLLPAQTPPEHSVKSSK